MSTKNLQEAYLSVYNRTNEDYNPPTPPPVPAEVRKSTKKPNITFAKGHETNKPMDEYDSDEFPTHKNSRKKPPVASTIGSIPPLPPVNKEEVDIYDIILSHLLDEGYAKTPEAAEAIMENMSEGWVNEILDEAVRGSGRSIGNRITGMDIRRVTRGNKKVVYNKPKWEDDVENQVSRGVQSRRRGEIENKNDLRDRERIEANKKSIDRLNAKPGQDYGDYDAGYHGDDDTSGGTRHYSLSRTSHAARRMRSSGR